MDTRGFVVFSDDWGEHPSSCQHIFKHILRWKHKVIWVNTVGMRPPRPTVTDLKKAAKKLKKMLGHATETRLGAMCLPSNLVVLQPPMFPYNRGVFRTFNKISVQSRVKKAMVQFGVEHPIVVATVPNACDYVGCFGEERIVYYCVDDFANWPGISKGLVKGMERKLVEKADMFIATSMALYHRLSEAGRPVHLLTHGVEIYRFANASISPHKSLSNIPSPRVGYVGLIDERLDLDLLEGILSRCKDVSLVMVGKREIDLGRLLRYHHFYHIPPCRYEDVPSMLRGLDVCILPYKVNEFTHTLNPLKLKEYLAAGRKVISVPLREVIPWKDYVRLASGKEEWVEAIQQLASEEGGDKGCVIPAALSRETWEEKAKLFREIVLGA